jgi:hypothetical protein
MVWPGGHCRLSSEIRCKTLHTTTITGAAVDKVMSASMLLSAECRASLYQLFKMIINNASATASTMRALAAAALVLCLTAVATSAASADAVAQLGQQYDDFAECAAENATCSCDGLVRIGYYLGGGEGAAAAAASNASWAGRHYPLTRHRDLAI